MIDYGELAAFDAHNLGLLAGMRARTNEPPVPPALPSEQQVTAWLNGYAEGRSLSAAYFGQQATEKTDNRSH